MHFAILGGHSGVQLETECYVPHIAEFDFSRYLVCPQSQLVFITGEKAAVALQCYQSLKHTGRYEKSRDDDLESIADLREREAMQILYSQVERLMARLESLSPCERIAILARLAYHSTALQGQITTAASAKDVELIDQLHLKLHRLMLVIAALQPGCTFSAAEGKATLLEKGGQVCDGEVRQRRKSLSSFYERTSDELLEQHPQFRRKASLPLRLTISHSEQLARRVLKDETKKIVEPEFEASTFQTLLIAAYEEIQQLEEALYPDKDAIGVGKYALRVASHLLQALKLSEHAHKGHIRTAEKLEKTAVNLERCKRRHSVSSEIATVMLSDVIYPSVARRGSGDLTRIHAVVSQMFIECDSSTYTPRERVDFLKEKLKGFKDLFVDVEKSEVLEILHAHAGLPSPDKIHDAAARLSLQGLNVEEFFADLVALGREVRNFARKTGLIPISSPEMAKFYDFVKEVDCF